MPRLKMPQRKKARRTQNEKGRRVHQRKVDGALELIRDKPGHKFMRPNSTRLPSPPKTRPQRPASSKVSLAINRALTLARGKHDYMKSSSSRTVRDSTN